MKLVFETGFESSFETGFEIFKNFQKFQEVFKDFKNIENFKADFAAGKNKENQGPFELRRRQIGYYDVFLLFGENVRHV